MAYKALRDLAFVYFSDLLCYWYPLSFTFIKSWFCCGSLTMQACSSSGTFYVLISFIGMLLIPGIHITHDLLWPFIQVPPQVFSPQEVFLDHSTWMTPISHPPVSSPLPYFLHGMYWYLTLYYIFICLWFFVPLKCKFHEGMNFVHH